MTTFLAIWGAILSAVVAVRNVHKDIRDRAALRVQAYRSELTERDAAKKELLKCQAAFSGPRGAGLKTHSRLRELSLS
jgi:hypothetical protein